MARKQRLEINDLSVEEFTPESGQPLSSTLLFCHGAWVGGWIWEQFASFLADQGYRSVVPTWRGRYDSRPVPDVGKLSVMDFVEDALGVAAETHPDGLVGESMGGLIALKAAESLPELKALVVMNPAPPFMVPMNPVVLLNQIRYLGDLLLKRPNKPRYEDYRKMILNNVGDEAEARSFYERICPDSGRALQEMSLGRIKVDPGRIAAATCVVAGHLDPLLPPKVHRRLADMLGATLVEYPNRSHHTFSEEGWEDVASEIDSWLQEILTPSAA